MQGNLIKDALQLKLKISTMTLQKKFQGWKEVTEFIYTQQSSCKLCEARKVARFAKIANIRLKTWMPTRSHEQEAESISIMVLLP
jgi:hypothetical protein